MSKCFFLLKMIVALVTIIASTVTAQDTPINVKVNSDTSPYLQNEQQIWISPFDANIVIADWRDWRLGYRRVGIGVSTDGGYWWSDSLFTDTPYEKHSDPCLVGDRLGNFYVCLLNYTGEQEDGLSIIVVYKSTDNGASWTGPVPISVNGPYFEDKQFTTVDRTGGTYDGNYYVSWARFPNPTRILFARSIDGAATFEDTITLGPSPYYEDCGGYIDAGQFSIPIVHPSGDVHVFWQHYDVEPGCTGSPAIMQVVSVDGGQSFSDPEVAFHNNLNYDWVDGDVNVYGMPNGDCDISGGPYNGTIYISQCQYAYEFGETDVTVRKSTDNGQSWSDRQVINDDLPGMDTDQFHPWLVVNEDGVVLLIFYDQRDDPSHWMFNAYFSASFDGGETYIHNMRISDVSIDPSLAKSGESPPRQRDVYLDNGKVDLTQREPDQPRAGLFAEYIGIHANNDTVSTIWTDTRLGNQDCFSARFIIPFMRPRLYLPSDASVVAFNPIEFVWSTCWHEAMDEYRLEITDNPTFSTVDYVYENVIDNRFAMPDDLSNGTWYWRVMAIRTSDYMITDYSEVFEFDFEQAAGPAVVSNSPASGEQNVPMNTDISATFDSDMDELTLNDNSMVVNGSMSGRHSGVVAYSAPTRTATFDPNGSFIAGEIVQVTLTTDISSSLGAPMDKAYSWAFTVQAGPGSAEFTLTGTYAVGTQPCWVTGGDLDGDGDVDLITANDEADSVTVLLNAGTGVFEIDSSYWVGLYPQSVVVADFDADGALDLATADGDQDALFVMFGNGDGTFHPETSYAADATPWTVVTADFNGDGYPDLANTNYFAHNVSVFLNDGDGTFSTGVEYPTTAWAYAIGLCTGDFDGDADIDLAVAEWGGSVAILLNDGDGLFSSGATIPVSQYPVSICCGDFDHDLDIDLAIGLFVADSIAVLVNDGDAGFTPDYYAEGDTFTVCVTCADLNGDGYLDLSSGSSGIMGEDSVAIHLNDGFGEFPTKSRFISGDSPYSIFAADLDGDGDLDLAAANYESDDLAILLNGPGYVTGDANGSGSIDIDDVVFEIAYIFSGGPPPEPLASGDANCAASVDIDDVVYLIGYIFSGGPPPGDPDGNGVPDC